MKIKANYKGSDREMHLDLSCIEVAYAFKHGLAEVVCVETRGGKSILVLDKKLEDFADFKEPAAS